VAKSFSCEIALDKVGYHGPLSVEFEDAGVDRDQYAAEGCRFIRAIDEGS
jgi:sugar phosphate isomerase/epimerase